MTDGSVVVLGLGNIIMSDEGVGVHVIRRLVDKPGVITDARLVDGGTLGLELLSIASGADLLIVIDAINLELEPGTLVRLGAHELFAMDRGVSAHQLGVADLLSALRLLGTEPGTVVMLGVQPAHLGLGTELSPEVECAVDRLVEQVMAEIACWQSNRAVVSYA